MKDVVFGLLLLLASAHTLAYELKQQTVDCKVTIEGRQYDFSSIQQADFTDNDGVKYRLHPCKQVTRLSTGDCSDSGIVCPGYQIDGSGFCWCLGNLLTASWSKTTPEINNTTHINTTSEAIQVQYTGGSNRGGNEDQIRIQLICSPIEVAPTQVSEPSTLHYEATWLTPIVCQENTVCPQCPVDQYCNSATKNCDDCTNKPTHSHYINTTKTCDWKCNKLYIHVWKWCLARALLVFCAVLLAVLIVLVVLIVGLGKCGFKCWCACGVENTNNQDTRQQHTNRLLDLPPATKREWFES